MDIIKTFFEKYLTVVSLPKITVIDVLEILIIAFALYHIIIWVKKTRAWMLVKGIIVLCIFCVIAIVLDMSVILWIFKNTIGVGITAIIIVFQPELRKALEQLGRKNYISSIIPFDDQKDKYERFSDRTINEIVRATFEMAKTKTGALIVIERDIDLNEYERTGIILDSVISSQLLINIFEHNTPLHDGAVIIKGDKIRSATCYLPLSENLSLSKALGTRHRAGVGISEVTDSVTIIVSEETGRISIAQRGRLRHNVKEEELRACLVALQNKVPAAKKGIPGVGILRKKGKESDEA